MAVWKLDSVSLASRKRLPSCRSISVRSVSSAGSLLRPLRRVFRGTLGLMPKWGLDAGVDIEEIGYGRGEGFAVEDSRVAEDVHEEGVGAVAGVELHPAPVFASPGAGGKRCGVWLIGVARLRWCRWLRRTRRGSFRGGPVRLGRRGQRGVGAGGDLVEELWRRAWARARALRSRRRRVADQAGVEGIMSSGYGSFAELIG